MLRMAGVRSARIVTIFVFLLGLSLPFDCAGLFGGGSNKPSPVNISPATACARAKNTLPFPPKAIGTMNPSFVWSVNGIVGGDEALGKISTGGLYSAPAALPTLASDSIEVGSASGKTLSGKTEIALEKPIPTVTAISPTAVPVGTFSISGTPTLRIIG